MCKLHQKFLAELLHKQLLLLSLPSYCWCLKWFFYKRVTQCWFCSLEIKGDNSQMLLLAPRANAGVMFCDKLVFSFCKCHCIILEQFSLSLENFLPSSPRQPSTFLRLRIWRKRSIKAVLFYVSCFIQYLAAGLTSSLSCSDFLKIQGVGCFGRNLFFSSWRSLTSDLGMQNELRKPLRKLLWYKGGSSSCDSARMRISFLEAAPQAHVAACLVIFLQ